VSEDKLQIKLTKHKPHKVYKAKVEVDEHIKQLCKFLRKHKDKKLEMVINGKSIKFDSVAGRKRFAAGFEHAFNIIEKHIKKYVDETRSEIRGLNDKVSSAQQEAMRFKEEAKETTRKFVTRHTVMDIRAAAWKDRVAELEDDRKILKAEIERLRKL
jgi:hypothetical protein